MEQVRPVLFLDRCQDRRPYSSVRNLKSRLSNCSPLSARAEIRAILASIYIPSTQVLVTIRKALVMLEAHARVHYSDQHAYRSTINAAHRKPAVVRPLCITGLPGVGKTALCESLIRLMDEKPVIEVGPGITDCP